MKKFYEEPSVEVTVVGVAEDILASLDEENSSLLGFKVDDLF